MQGLFNTCLVLALLTATGCGEDESEAPPQVNAPASVTVEGAAPTVTAEPTHGGTIVAAGPHPVEVVAHDDGAIEAYVVGSAPPPEAQLTVTVPTDEGPRPVVLVWEDDRYYGVVEGPTIVQGPTEVVYVVDDRAYRGRVDTVVVVEAPRPRPPRADVVVRGPRPRGRVVVEHPVPRARVDVQVGGAPPPPGVVVRHRGPRIRHHGRRMRRRGPRARAMVRHRRHRRQRRHRRHRMSFRRRGRR